MDRRKASDEFDEEAVDSRHFFRLCSTEPNDDQVESGDNQDALPIVSFGGEGPQCAVGSEPEVSAICLIGVRRGWSSSKIDPALGKNSAAFPGSVA